MKKIELNNLHFVSERFAKIAYENNFGAVYAASHRTFQRITHRKQQGLVSANLRVYPMISCGALTFERHSEIHVKTSKVYLMEHRTMLKTRLFCAGFRRPKTAQHFASV